MSKERYRRQIFSLAKEALANHVLKQRVSSGDFSIWSCENPDSSFYWYRIVCMPGCIIIQGDVGNRIFSVYDKDVIGWLRGAIKSPDYVMGKCEDKHKEFVSDEAKRILNELREEHPEIVDEIEDKWADEHDDYQLIQAMHESSLTDVSEYTEMFYDFNPDVIWSYACLDKFIQLLDSQATKV